MNGVGWLSLGMKEKLKVGMSCDVITITAEQPKFVPLMNKGNTGIVTMQYSDGDVTACIGNNVYGEGIWLVPKEEFKKVGRLTITKLK